MCQPCSCIFFTLQEPIPCDILVLEESSGNRVVATGTLLKSVPGELVHGVPLLEDHVKVKILHVVEGEENTPLPLPFFGHESLGEIKGSWAQWPRSQVRLSIEVTLIILIDFSLSINTY